MNFGKYEVLSEIARGGMGVVYKARDPFIDRVLAVKTLLPDAEIDEQLKRRMIVEARAAGNLRHPNIVTIYDLGVIDGRPYIAMEYLEGMDLGRVIRKHPRVLLANRLRILATVADAFDFAHRRNIIHRDIKPPNIFVLSTGLLKIVDFGIARVSDATLTSTGQVMGTLAYMAPEQLSGKAIDRRADVFGLGVVAYELLSRQRPFRSPEMPNLLHQILNETHPPCPGLAPEIAPDLNRILDRALAKDPALRYPSMAELAADLRRLAAEKAEVVAAVDAANVAELRLRIERAESLLAARRFEESILAIREAIDLDPTDERALGLAERIEEDRFRDLVRTELGRIQGLVERNELKNARNALRQILRRDSSLLDVRKLLVDVEERLRAAGELEKDVDLAPGLALPGEDAAPVPSAAAPAAKGPAEVGIDATQTMSPSGRRVQGGVAATPASVPVSRAAEPTARAGGRRLALFLGGIVTAAVATAVVMLLTRSRPASEGTAGPVTQPAARTPASSPVDAAASPAAAGPVAVAAITATVTPGEVASAPGAAVSPADAPPPSPASPLIPVASPAIASEAIPSPPPPPPGTTPSSSATTTPTRGKSSPTPTTAQVAAISPAAGAASPPRTTAKPASPSPIPADAVRDQRRRVLADALVAEALTAASARRWADTRVAYENAIKSVPEDPRVASWRAWIDAETRAETADADFGAGRFAAAAAGYAGAAQSLAGNPADLGLGARIQGQQALAEGETRLAAGDFAEAEAAFARTADAEAGRAGVKRARLGRLKLEADEAARRGDADAARQRFEAILKDSPGDAAAAEGKRQAEEAATRRQADQVQTLERDAEAALAQDYSRAASLYAQLLERRPGDREVESRLKLSRALAGASAALQKKDCAAVVAALAGVEHAAARKMLDECASLARPGRGQVEQGMVAIPAGRFEMGEDGGLADMKPGHEVALDAYLIDKFKVTNDQYLAFLRASGRKASPPYWREGAPPTGQGNHPVREVSFADAGAFCRWAGKRLPSEAEWEHAARGPKNHRYPWGGGHDPSRYNSSGRTVPVSSGSPSEFGVVGLIDYIWEWTASPYTAYPGNREADPRYGSGLMVVRGRLKTKGDSVLSAACRHPLEPDALDEHVGFRCAIGAAELARLPE